MLYSRIFLLNRQEIINFVEYRQPEYILLLVLKKTILLSVIIAVITLLQSCSDKTEFIIEGSIKGVDSQSVTLTYYTKGGLKHNTIKAIEGQFQFIGESLAPTMAIISISPTGDRIATLVVKNGDKIIITADLDNLLTPQIEGNQESEKIARWIAENAETILSKRPEKINSAIKEYVSKHRSDLSATAILTSYYLTDGYESSADSLLSILNAEARRPEMVQGFNNVIADFIGAQISGPVPFMSLYSVSDSMININPLRHTTTLLCFLDENRQTRDSVVKQMKSLNSKYTLRELMQAEISIAPDSMSWRKSLGKDTVDWAQTWVQGSVAAAPIRKLGVRQVPYFIAADSTGHSIYRGSSITSARQAIEKILKK